jgi:hypothetical protein
VAATVGNDESQKPIIVGALTALDLCRYQEYLHEARPAGIPTHSRQLDDLLAFPPESNCSTCGGLPFGYVTQVTGPPATGKTQLALGVAAQHAADSGKVFYLASGFGHGTLLPLVRRLQHFCTANNFQNVIQNVTFATVNDGYEALTALEQVADEKRILVILDSASGCLSADLYASGDGDAGLMLSQWVAHTLRRVARHNGAAVLVTNGTVSGEGSGVKPAMGQAWYAADVALWFQATSTGSSVEDLIESTSGSKRIRATLEHHWAKPCHRLHTIGDQTVEFMITSTGIADVVMD